MCEFRPNTTLNAAAMTRLRDKSARNSVICSYSSKHTNSIDHRVRSPTACRWQPGGTEDRQHSRRALTRRSPGPGSIRVTRGEHAASLSTVAWSLCLRNDEVAVTTGCSKATPLPTLATSADNVYRNQVNLTRSATSTYMNGFLRDAWLTSISKLLHLTRTDIDPEIGEATKKTTSVPATTNEAWSRLLEHPLTRGPGTSIWRCTCRSGQDELDRLAPSSRHSAAIRKPEVFDTSSSSTDRNQCSTTSSSGSASRSRASTARRDDQRRRGAQGRRTVTSKSGLLAKIAPPGS